MLRDLAEAMALIRLMAVQAMALVKLDRFDEAQALIAEFKEFSVEDLQEVWRYDETARALLAEARRRIEGSAAQPEPPENSEEGEN